MFFFEELLLSYKSLHLNLGEALVLSMIATTIERAVVAIFVYQVLHLN